MTFETQLTSLVQAIGVDVKEIKDRLNTYEFTQMVPSNLWTVTHNLGKHPSVDIVDSAGSLVIGAVKYINNNQIQIEFSFEFSGKAYLN